MWVGGVSGFVVNLSTCHFGVAVVNALMRSTFFVVAGTSPLASFSTLDVDSRCLLVAPCHSMDLPAWTFISQHPRQLRYRCFVVQDLTELVARSSPLPLERHAQEPFWWAVRLILWPCGPSACCVWVCGISSQVVDLSTGHIGFWAARRGCEAHAGSRFGCGRCAQSSRCSFVLADSLSCPLTLSTLFLDSATFRAVSRLVTTPGRLFFDSRFF